MGFVMDIMTLGEFLLGILLFPLSVSCHCGYLHSYITSGMNNRAFAGSSSEA
jgi:hypothetical protein